MKGFVFAQQFSEFSEICGTSLVNDTIQQLKASGITEIYYNGTEKFTGVINASFDSVREQLGEDWLAVYAGSISRQSPQELRNRAIQSKADYAISLACSSTPWEEFTVLTDHTGLIEDMELNPSPENTKTNMCFSGMIWVGNSDFNPDFIDNINTHSRCFAFLIQGYWKNIRNRESYLLASYNILMREVLPWPHTMIPETGRIIKSPIPDSVLIKGVIWVDTECLIEECSTLENCILLKGVSVGNNCNLRNCLLLPGISVKSNTTRHDKYLSIIGDENG